MTRMVLTLALGAILIAALGSSLPAAERAFTDEFGMVKGDMSSTGRNPYFILEPGYKLVLEDKDTKLIITVLDETKMVDGVETRIAEERESENGRLVEVSRNYFAISKRTNSVFYFGEAVDMYDKAGKVTHGGSWLAGVDGARAGVMIPGVPLLGARYYQEVAPKVAMDRAEIVSLSETLTTSAGKYEKVMKTEETTPLEPDTTEYKYYAPGVGLIKDGSLVLVQCTTAP